jgi:DNA repair protein RadC
MAITDWPLDDRPREKLLNKGAETLSDAELVAIFLRTGVRGKSAVDVAREALARFGSLSGLFAAGADALTAVSGLGAAKYVQLQAVLELARCATTCGSSCRTGRTRSSSVSFWTRRTGCSRWRSCFAAR